jgi:ATP-dependent DNA helicase RecQ
MPLMLTIGYAKRTLDETIAQLKVHDVEFLVDVRSSPWSQRYPDFSRNALPGLLGPRGITYMYMGDELGGRPDGEDLRDDEGHVLYDACMQRPQFQHGIGRLRKAWSDGRRVALLCAEARPDGCHRSRLLGRALVETGIDVLHIDEDGTPLTQDEVMARIRGPQLALIPEMVDDPGARSRGKYPPHDE